MGDQRKQKKKKNSSGGVQKLGRFFKLMFREEPAEVSVWAKGYAKDYEQVHNLQEEGLSATFLSKLVRGIADESESGGLKVTFMSVSAEESAEAEADIDRKDGDGDESQVAEELAEAESVSDGVLVFRELSQLERARLRALAHRMAAKEKQQRRERRKEREVEREERRERRAIRDLRKQEMQEFWKQEEREGSACFRLSKHVPLQTRKLAQGTPGKRATRGR